MTDETTIQKRACKGGEIAPNGEFYEGGRFINTIPENAKRRGSSPRKPHKVQIEPYVWAEDDRKPIFSIVGTFATYIDRSDWRKGIKPFLPVFESGWAHPRTVSEIQALCDRFNAGERWM